VRWENKASTLQPKIIVIGNSKMIASHRCDVFKTRCSQSNSAIVIALTGYGLPYVIRQTIIFLPCNFFLSIYLLLSSIFFSSPNFSGRGLDVYHTLTHGVALVRIWNAGLKGAARGSLQMQDPKKSPKIAIWAPSHNFVGLYLRN